MVVKCDSNCNSVQISLQAISILIYCSISQYTPIKTLPIALTSGIIHSHIVLFCRLISDNIKGSVGLAPSTQITNTFLTHMAPPTRSKDLLSLEQKNPTLSSLESTLLVCEKSSIPQIPKPNTASGKLLTNSTPKSEVLGKVKDFLGVMAEANTRLQNVAKDKSNMDYDIEVLTGNEAEYIEMDLVLGVADLHTPEAVAAAESAMAGSVSVIPLSAANCSGFDTESSSDDDEDDNRDGNCKGGSSDKDVILNTDQPNKRQKIIELP